MHVAVIHELVQCAQGTLAVAATHLQLAKQRVNAEDRLTHDHLDTAIVFLDSTVAVLGQLIAPVAAAGEEKISRVA